MFDNQFDSRLYRVNGVLEVLFLNIYAYRLKPQFMGFFYNNKFTIVL